MGTGKAQLFAITIDKPLDKSNVHSFAYLFDAYAGQTLYTGKPFNYDMYDDLFAADVNGDGKVELCHIHQTGMDVYAFSSNAVCTKLFTVPEINQELFYTKKFFVGDVNGDGKCDVVISPELSYYRDVSREVHAGAFETCFDCGALYPYDYCSQCHKKVGRNSRCIKCGESLDWQGACEEHGELFWLTETEYFDNGSIWTIYYGNGKGFTKKNSGYVCTYEASKNFCLQDVNSDGAADLIVGYNKWEKTQSKIVRYYFSKDSTFVRSSAVSIENDMRLVPSDIAIPNYYNFLLAIKDGKLHRINYTTNKAKQRLLTGMANSLGVVQHNYYLRLNEEDPSVSEYFYTKDWDAKYPYNDYEGPLWAVARQKVFADSVRVSDLAYQYEGAIMHRQGLGFRGFKKIHTEDWLRYAETSVHTYNPLQYGIPVSVETDKEKENYTYDVSVATNKKLKANMTGKVSVNKLTGVTTTGSYLYDNYGNCLSETMAYSDGTSAPTAEERKVHLCLNQTTSGRYLIGLPLEETHILERGNEEWREQEEITYQANTPLPIKRITRVYDSDDMVYKTGETRYTYDAYGNVLTKKQAAYNSTIFVGDTYTYDANGRYLSTVTDALGRTTTYHTYNKWGKPASATNHLGKQTTYAYDALGRNTTTIAADGTTQSVSYLWNPGKGVFGILKSATGSPDELVCYDVLKREVRSGQQRFDGNWMYVDKEYDEYGLLERESLPFKGSAASKWNIYTYDGYDRLTKVNEASGKQTTYSYSGNSVTTTEKGISTTRTNNAVGELVKVSDSSGEAVYHYRADGQLSDIVAPGNVVTSFEYDVYGRKTKLVDPSAGTQTYTETNHTNGSRTTTQTDAKGLTTTVNYDAYGRVTSVNRPEFNTSYTYDAVTKELKSEVSTNGTKKEYTSDVYGSNAGSLSYTQASKPNTLMG